MTKRTLLIAIPVVAVVLNGVGYLIFVKTRTAPTAVAPDSSGGRPPQGATGNAATPPQAGTAEPKVSAEQAEAAREAEAQTRRASGLAALEAGDYDKALIHFTEAKALIGDKANVADLLKVTEDLRKRPQAPIKAKGTATASTPRKSSSRGSSRRVALREEPDVESPPPPPPAAAQPGGLLIVTTTPRGMLVHVDDTPVDLTPMKTKVRPGSHRVALLDGDRKVYETTVDIKEGGTATLLRDLTAEHAAEAPRPTAAPVTPPPAREEARPAMGAAATTTSDAPATTNRPTQQTETTSTKPATIGAMGTLEITSPGLYGVVWVNGRPRGYPPLAVRDLPPGPVKVEVRVNGVQKRIATAMVKAGLTTSVKLRASEASR